MGQRMADFRYFDHLFGSAINDIFEATKRIECAIARIEHVTDEERPLAYQNLAAYCDMIAGLLSLPISKLQDRTSRLSCLIIELSVNTIIHHEMLPREDEQDYASKKQIVQNWNNAFRRDRVAIQNPIDKEPCLLLAVNSHDGYGRYTLENRHTKKRTGSYKSIFDLMPIQFVPDIPRKEGVIERRKKQAEEVPEQQQRPPEKDAAQRE